MLIDVICLILVVWAVFKGFRNGLVVAVFSFLAFFIGLAAALKLSATAAAYLEENTNISQRLLPFLAFALVFILVVFLVRLGAKAIEGMLSVAMLGWLNRLGGALFYLLLYLFIFSILLFYAEQIRLIKPEGVQNSVTYPFIHPLGPKMVNALGYIIPWFSDMFTDLQSFFDRVSSAKAEQ